VIACGHTAAMASGRPCRPSPTTMHTSPTPRFLELGEHVRPGLGALATVAGPQSQDVALAFGRGFKAEPKSLASVRVVPMCDRVREAIGRQLAGGARPEDLVLPGPGGSNGVVRGARAPLSTNNLRRVYKAVVEAAGAELAHLDLRGPHDLRHTFATWLEDAGVPSRVIDELMDHARGRDRGAGGSPMGRVYRETTPAMLARVTAALDDRLGVAERVAAYLLRERRNSRAADGGEGR
jgi:Phage integrase family